MPEVLLRLISPPSALLPHPAELQLIAGVRREVPAAVVLSSWCEVSLSAGWLQAPAASLLREQTAGTLLAHV